MTESKALGLSDWIAETISRWRIAAMIAACICAAAILAIYLLPPVYEARSTFLPTEVHSATISAPTASLGGDQPARGLLRLARDQSDPAQLYVQVLGSEEIRRRLLRTRFPDPRSATPTDSATLLDILGIRNSDSARRVEIASRKLSRAIITKPDPKTGLIELRVRARWPELSAQIANRAVAATDEFSREKRAARAHARRIFLETRVDSVRDELQMAELEQRSFYERNRDWRGSPAFISEATRLRRAAAETGEFYRSLVQQLEAARLEEINAAVPMTVIDHAVPPRKAYWPRYGLLVASALGISLLLGGFVTGAIAFLSRSARRPTLPQVDQPIVADEKFHGWTFGRLVFPVFAWGLVFHSFIIAALIGLGLSPSIVRVIAGWKEVALALVLVITIVRATSGRGPRTQIVASDLWITGLIATALFMLLAENLWFRLGIPPTAELLGFRDAIYFMFAYFIGRSMPELARDSRMMRALFAVILVTSIIGVLERLFVTPEMLVALGVASYYQDFLGLSAFTVGNEYGLPLNYWTRIGGHLFRRAGSVYLSGQGFAVPFLLFYPLATAWVFMREKISRMHVIAFAIISTALLLTVTRQTIFIAILQLMLFASFRKRPMWAVGALVGMGLVFMTAMLTIRGFPSFVWGTLSWQESSSQSHLNDWIKGLAVFAENPWGSGLGTADQSAVRAGLKHLTGDNLYLKYAVEMGLAGLTFFVLVLASIATTGMRLYKRGVNLSERRLGMTLWLAAIGIAVNGITAVVFNSISLGWIFFWLAGAAATAQAASDEVAVQVVPRRRSPLISGSSTLDPVTS